MEKQIGNTDINEVDHADTDYIVDLLMKCCPDMLPASADALARVRVMETSLQVVQETRSTITESNPDFIVITLLTLFEEKLTGNKDKTNITRRSLINMLHHIAGTGLNIGVILIYIVVFFVALFAMMGIANSQKPNTMDILSAAHNLNVGQSLTPNNIVVKTVFVDSNTEMYIPATDDGIASIMGSVVVVPHIL